MTGPGGPSSPTIRHVLLDADGVLQRVDPGWQDVLPPLLGERTRDLLEAFWMAEKPALVGDGEVLDALQASLDAFDVDARAADVYPLVWESTEVLPHTLDLLAGLRGLGLGVHLGTNQTRRRAVHMRTGLGYDDLFDVSVYSCDVGVAKPDPAYFTRAVDLIGADPAEVLFVDDHERNVEGAREAGLAAEHWRHDLGLPALHDALARHGVLLTP